MKVEREDIWMILGSFILCAIMAAAGWAVAEGIITAREHKKIVNQAIGSTIIIGRDTLEIVNYQQGGFGRPAGFLLSNGLIVNERVIKCQIQNELDKK